MNVIGENKKMIIYIADNDNRNSSIIEEETVKQVIESNWNIDFDWNLFFI